MINSEQVSWSRQSGPPCIPSAGREPCPLRFCQPSAAAPRPRPLPVRARLHAPPHVKAAQRSEAPEGLGLDVRMVHWVGQHGRQRCCERGRKVYQMVSPTYTRPFSKLFLPRFPFSERKSINPVSSLLSGFCGSPTSVTRRSMRSNPACS